MSVGLTHYLGIGYKLDYDKNREKVDTFLDDHPEFSSYGYLNPNNNGGLQIIVDGMNGDYIYVMYVLQKTDQEDMYCSSGAEFTEFSLLNANPEASPAISVRELYHNVTGDNPDDPVLISLFHCS